MLIVWQYHKHKKTLQKTRKSAITESPCNKEKYDNKVVAVISLNKTTNDEDEWRMKSGNLPPSAFMGYWSEQMRLLSRVCKYVFKSWYL